MRRITARQCFSMSGNTGALTALATSTLEYDFYPYIKRRPDVRRWQVDWIHILRSGSVAQASAQIDQVKADEYDVGLTLVWGAAPPVVVPSSLGGLLPTKWQGRLSLRLTNQSGVSVTFIVAAAISPATWEESP